MKIVSRSCVLVLLFTGFHLAYAQDSVDSMRLPVQEFAKRMQDFPDAPIVDIRTPEEYAQGHLINAVNIDWYAPDFIEQMARFDKKKPVFLYCRSGNRSGQALTKLQAAGFTGMFELKTGILSWIEEGLPQSGQ